MRFQRDIAIAGVSIGESGGRGATGVRGRTSVGDEPLVARQVDLRHLLGVDLTTWRIEGGRMGQFPAGGMAFAHRQRALARFPKNSGGGDVPVLLRPAPRAARRVLRGCTL